MTRKQIWPYLSDDVFNRFKKYVAKSGSTESSVVEAALSEYFNETKDMTLIMRRLDRLSRSVGRLERDISLLSEAFGVFVQIWFAHTPEISQSEKDVQSRLAFKRYNDFANYVAKQFSSGHSFVDDLSKSDLADNDDLSRLARK